ncbi:hydroxyethylthiazole kinase [Candidatus Ichthyocystis sparus]|uniref:hydroxyethylthiazole kinase n=1 Tax=Candidatus Ichthyocystis sparus TaxID=1561004 RepID=UPI000AA6C027|nr:hydroxyethylthiazole kinase [Candidatus Ichthyocystis sparus]
MMGSFSHFAALGETVIPRIMNHFRTVRSTKPVVACLTNFVTTEFVANSLLAIGASPIMSQDQRETDDLVLQSQVLYVNIGTLSKSFLEQAQLAVEIAKENKKIVILDPVGAGFSRIRTAAAKQFVGFSSVIRGNVYEIAALIGKKLESPSKGADSIEQDAEEWIELAQSFCQKHKLTLAITGRHDYIVDAKNISKLSFGSPVMCCITGMGCALSAVIAALCTTSDNHFKATYDAVSYFSICGQCAAKKTSLPGHFRCHFIDLLNSISEEEMMSVVKSNSSTL